MGEAEVDAERGERVLHPVPARGRFGNSAVLGFTASGQVSEVEGEGVGPGWELPVGDRRALGIVATTERLWRSRPVKSVACGAAADMATGGW